MPFDPNSAFSFINTPTFHVAVFVLRIIFIIASAGMLGFIIWALIKTSWVKRYLIWDLEEFFSYHPYGAKKLYKGWQKIRLRLETGLESEYKLAVIEADSALDDVLKTMGFVGNTLGERLEKLTEATIPSLAGVIEAHAVRNNIVHDPDYRLSMSDAKRALDFYEAALTDLQVL